MVTPSRKLDKPTAPDEFRPQSPEAEKSPKSQKREANVALEGAGTTQHPLLRWKPGSLPLLPAMTIAMTTGLLSLGGGRGVLG